MSSGALQPRPIWCLSVSTTLRVVQLYRLFIHWHVAYGKFTDGMFIRLMSRWLRRSRYPAAWTRSRIWCDENRARVDTLVPDRSHAAGLVLRSPVADTVRTVRRAARVSAGSTAVRALHRRAGTDHRAPRPTSTHVRRRLPGVPQHVRQRCSSGS